MVLAVVTKYFSAAGTTGSAVIDDGRDESNSKLETADTRRTAEAMDQFEDFEALRPPYLHVRQLPFGNDVATANQAVTGDACGRPRWDNGRYANALAGHGEDATTGRSAHAAEVHIHGHELLDHLSAGRRATWTLRRSYTSLPRLLLRHSYILWHVRVEQT
jgi:hypothetical protein